jgi:hypothetical protein
MRQHVTNPVQTAVWQCVGIVNGKEVLRASAPAFEMIAS